MHPPAAWLPDPAEGACGLRWWDGESWTAHTHPGRGDDATASPEDESGLTQSAVRTALQPAAVPAESGAWAAALGGAHTQPQQRPHVLGLSPALLRPQARTEELPPLALVVDTAPTPAACDRTDSPETASPAAASVEAEIAALEALETLDPREVGACEAESRDTVLPSPEGPDDDLLGAPLDGAQLEDTISAHLVPEDEVPGDAISADETEDAEAIPSHAVVLPVPVPAPSRVRVARSGVGVRRLGVHALGAVPRTREEQRGRGGEERADEIRLEVETGTAAACGPDPHPRAVLDLEPACEAEVPAAPEILEGPELLETPEVSLAEPVLAVVLAVAPLEDASGVVVEASGALESAAPAEAPLPPPVPRASGEAPTPPEETSSLWLSAQGIPVAAPTIEEWVVSAAETDSPVQEWWPALAETASPVQEWWPTLAETDSPVQEWWPAPAETASLGDAESAGRGAAGFPGAGVWGSPAAETWAARAQAGQVGSGWVQTAEAAASGSHVFSPYPEEVRRGARARAHASSGALTGGGGDLPIAGGGAGSWGGVSWPPAHLTPDHPPTARAGVPAPTPAGWAGAGAVWPGQWEGSVSAVAGHQESRQRWIAGGVAALVLVGTAVAGVLTHEQQRERYAVVLPETVQGMPVEPTATRQLQSGLPQDVLEQQGRVWRDPQSGRAIVFSGAETPSAGAAESAAAGARAGMQKRYPRLQTLPVTVGAPGMECGRSQDPAAMVTICVWHDPGSYGVLVLTPQPSTTADAIYASEVRAALQPGQ